jgi:hypothetical protein
MEGLEKDIDVILKEKDDSVRYAKIMDQRLKDISKKEEEANVKILTLLDDVENLTEEN